jgi:peptidoglycan L-alanyl-D-glutamate endopeptidase CwlK
MNIANKMKSDLKLKELYPVFAADVDDFLIKLERLGYSVGIFSGWRTFSEQNDLYAKGRTKEGSIVTNAKAGESWHCYGTACDVVFRDAYGNWTWDEPTPGDWDRLGEISKGFKLHWGGTFNDKPHFERNFGTTLEQCKKVYEDEGLHAVWKLFDKA